MNLPTPQGSVDLAHVMIHHLPRGYHPAHVGYLLTATGRVRILAALMDQGSLATGELETLLSAGPHQAGCARLPRKVGRLAPPREREYLTMRPEPHCAGQHSSRESFVDVLTTFAEHGNDAFVPVSREEESFTCVLNVEPGKAHCLD